jgi:hypothetical protein
VEHDALELQDCGIIVPCYRESYSAPVNRGGLRGYMKVIRSFGLGSWTKSARVGYALLLFALLLDSGSSRAATTTATSCSSSAVQSAINSASNGDTIAVPGGSCTWSGGAVRISKAITLDGGGTTNITFSGSSPALSVTVPSTGGNVYVTGFSFTQGFTNGQYPISLDVSNSGNNAFRFHHNTLSDGNPSGPATLIGVSGNGIGLIDHNTFTATQTADELIHVLGTGGDSSGWLSDVVPGSPVMIFIEDNTFTYNCPGCSYGGTSALQSYYGARTVIRYNTFKLMQIDQHGTAGMVWARWWEIYNNTWITTTGQNQGTYMDLRGGAGVVFNNTHTGPDQAHWGINLQDESGQLLGRVGRGIYNPSYTDPGGQHISGAYFWNNTDSSVVSGIMNVTLGNGAGALTSGLDYFNFNSSTTQPAMHRCESAADLSAGCPVSYTYVPYTYPHPLQGGPAPSPPSGLATVVH